MDLAGCIDHTIEVVRRWHKSDHFPDDVALLGLKIS
jgi:hypothetical protein